MEGVAKMAKGYWIAHVDVKDADVYRRYIEANAEAFAKFGARFIVRGGRFEAVEGATRSRNVVIEFPDFETAVACYRSPEYQRVKSLRQVAATSDVIIIEGYEGLQPSSS
jgi:uncharacterized protein (DUF1330 family)